MTTRSFVLLDRPPQTQLFGGLYPQRNRCLSFSPIGVWRRNAEFISKSAKDAGLSEAAFVEELISEKAKSSFVQQTIRKLKSEFLESFARNFWLVGFALIAFVLLTPWYYISEGYLIKAIGGLQLKHFNVQPGEAVQGVLHKYTIKSARLPPTNMKSGETKAFDLNISDLKLKSPPLAIIQSTTGGYYAESIFSFESIYCDNIRLLYHYAGPEETHNDYSFDMKIAIIPQVQGVDQSPETDPTDAELVKMRCEGRSR